MRTYEALRFKAFSLGGRSGIHEVDVVLFPRIWALILSRCHFPLNSLVHRLKKRVQQRAICDPPVLHPVKRTEGDMICDEKIHK